MAFNAPVAEEGSNNAQTADKLFSKAVILQINVIQYPAPEFFVVN